MRLISLAALLVTAAASAHAGTQNFSFTGTFSGDADVQAFNFTIGSLSTVTLISYSYAGGTMADGTVIAAGGFDPILALWDSAGNLIQQYDDGPEIVPADPVTGQYFDTHLILTNLAAGDYTATIAQYANFAAGSRLSNGFTQSNPFFTAAYGCSNGQFCDAARDNRTNFWAFDVLGVDSAVTPTIPVPATLPLIVAGLGALRLVTRRKA